ncbi:protein WHAT'S THIS FACTOR 9, mitochondrial [Macadamia integrifolia]|uniref:protein WHAT'S THIS FACTOR 9, mitochondrial n=1 Tax=Macadamia integrifolia TaxID=60698 RepID=UPI001C4FD282|nr:protein WHAT'S THIS FACTOR 9, mitochondrial [Macadamia integrifolia]
MGFNRTHLRKLKRLLFSSQRSLILYDLQPSFSFTQKSNYVDVKMRWKKDTFYDSIEIIHRSPELKPLLSLKNCIAEEPDGCIPICAISKSGFKLGVRGKVSSFLRRYPSVFEEFRGPKYNLPWFRLTPEAIDLDREERVVYSDRRADIVVRLKKLILMSKEKRLPFNVIRGLQFYLGLPDEFLKNPEANLGSSFRLMNMGDGLQGLNVDPDGETILSVMQKNAIMRGECTEVISYPLFASKGLRLKRKISNWLDEFQNLPYVSPYEDSSHLNPNSDISEKRVVGVLHELLSLFVDHSVQRKMLFCLRPYMDVPQKFYKAFERHPHMFYLSLRNKTCTAILKEPYNDDSAMEAHPILEMRKKYNRLMKKSEFILKNRRPEKDSEDRETQVDSELLESQITI